MSDEEEVWRGKADRYTDAYRAASTIITLGTIVKAIGAVAAGLIVLASIASCMFLGSQPWGFGFVFPALFGGLLSAAMIGLIFWIAGVLITSWGYGLRASLDTAVNTSPSTTQPAYQRATAPFFPAQSPYGNQSTIQPADQPATAPFSPVQSPYRDQSTIRPADQRATAPFFPVQSPDRDQSAIQPADQRAPAPVRPNPSSNPPPSSPPVDRKPIGTPPGRPPQHIVDGLPPGEHTFRNGQTWRKGADGSMTFVR